MGEYMPKKAELRKRFAEQRAASIARAVAPNARAIGPSSSPLSKYFSYFEAGETFILVAPDDASLKSDVKHALALGLGYAKGRPLHLVLPDDCTATTAVRVPFIKTETSISGYRDDNGRLSAEEVSPLSRERALAAARDWGDVADVADDMRAHAYAKGADWAIDLMDWVLTRRVATTVLKSYVAWHYQGRQVLKVKPVGSGLEISAGVQYRKPPIDQPQPIVRVFPLDETPSAQALTQIQQSVDLAIENRRTGVDAGHEEHALQAALLPIFDRFGLKSWLREFPAARPESKRAFIDYLGVDGRERLHVVETKIGPDHMLVVQGLDYWMWVTAHEEAFQQQFRLSKPAPAEIDFVVAEKGSLVHPLTKTQAAALVDEIDWRFHVVSGWKSPETVDVRSLTDREVPAAA